jgi:alpha-L-fucosidase 2
VKYSREYFCSRPQDLFVARFTADGGTMDLVLEARTAHKKNTIETKGREIHLRGAASMNRDDMEFMQAVRVVAGDGEVEAKTNGILSARHRSSGSIPLAGRPRTAIPTTGSHLPWWIRPGSW